MPLLPRFIRKRRLRWPFWTSTVIAVLILIIMVVGYWVEAGVSLRIPPAAHSLGVTNCSLMYQRYRGTDVAELDSQKFGPVIRWNSNPRLPAWRPAYFSSPLSPTLSVLILLILLYLLAAPFVLFSGFLFWRAPLIHAAGHCQQCGYDMTGIKDAAVCPECGV